MADIVGQKDKERAKNYYNRAIKIYESLFGPENLHCIVVYNNLAGMYLQSNETEQAQDLLNISLKISLKYNGVEHLDTAGIY